MNRIILSFLLIFTLFYTTGCNKGNNPQVKKKTHKKYNRSIPKSSKFRRIKKGMSSRQVTHIIGRPTDTGYFRTGKAWIPFYYGPDTSRTVYYYRHEGELQFNRRNRLVKITYNPSEDGYR